MENAETRTVKFEQMNPAPYNPRVDLKPEDPEYQAIKKSIESFGYLDPIVWNETTGNIVSGHQRFNVLKDLGYTEAECRVVHFDDATEKACNLALNKAVGLWDDDKLNALLEEMKNTEFDMSQYGFAEEMDLLNDAEEDDFDVEKELDQITEPDTQMGDIFALGDHRLMCGDSTKLSDVEKLMRGGEVADLVLTDPPYNVAVENSEGMTIQNDNMSSADFQKFIGSAMKCAAAVLKKGGAFYVWYGDCEDQSFRKACTDNGLDIKECLIWVKNSFNLGRQDYQWRHEPCLYGWKAGAGHYFINDRTQDTVLESKVDVNRMNKEELKTLVKQLMSDDTPSTIIHEDKPVKDADHPTMKPVGLFSRLVKNSSRRGEVVLDLFGGSGTTLVVCEQAGRSARIMEYDPKYCDVIIKRWEQLTGKKAELIKE